MAPEQLADGETATAYVHADGRRALLIADEVGEKYAVILDLDGELAATLPPESDVAYSWCPQCSSAYWSCYLTCTAPCWWELGFRQGCHTDCNDACTFFQRYCEGVYCPI